MRIAVALAVACLTVAGLSAADESSAAAKHYELDIPRQSLDTALKDLAQQTGLQVARLSDSVEGSAVVGPLNGDYSLEQALNFMLAPQELTFKVVNERTIAVVKHDANPDPATTAMTAVTTTMAAVPSDTGSADLPKNADSPHARLPADGQLEEIIVTAQKRSENLQIVPLSIGTISGQALKTYGEMHLTDFAAGIPGLEVESAYGVPGSVSISIRGISTADTDNTPTVATYIDDVPVSASGGNHFGNLIGADLFTYDIDHVEVLKGPQGTLYGASSLGGLLKYVTGTPDLNESSVHAGESTVAVNHSPDLGWGLNGAANVPIIPGQLALSISAAHVFTPGYIDNVATDARGFNHGVQDGARLALFWKPSDRLSVKLSGLYDHYDYAGLGQILADAISQKPLFGYTSTLAVEPEGQSNRTTLFTANVAYDFGWSSLTWLSGYSQSAAVFKVDASPTLGPVFGDNIPFVDHFSFDKFTQELRLSSADAARFHWLLGGFYTHEKSASETAAQALTPATNQPDPALTPFFTNEFANAYQEGAVFGNATYALTKAWDVTAGLRYSHNQQTFSDNAMGVEAGPPIHYAPTSGDKLTYSLSTQYHLAPDTMAYSRIATGYRPGGVNGQTLGAPVPTTFGSDTTTNYEIGLKSEWLDKTLLVNASVYYIDWKNIQVEVLVPPASYYYANAARATSQGVELSSNYIVARGLQIGLNATFIDATLASDASAVGGAKGDRLPDSAPWAGAFTADYTHALLGDFSGRLGLVWRYVGQRNAAFPASSNYERLASYQALNLSAGVSNQRWDFGLYVRNVADQRAYLTWNSGGPVILQPRTVGLNINAAF